MAFHLDDDGGLWFGSSSGLTHVAAASYHGPVDAPAVRLLSLSLGKRPLIGGAPEDEAPHTLRGAFVADSPDAAAVEYQLRLLPAQVAWRAAASRQVRFSELAPGDYQLEVQARVNGGAWGPVTRVPFSIPLGWWQARWVWGLAALIVVALTALLVLGWQRASMRRRTRALLAQTDASFRAFLASMPEIVIVRRGDGAIHLNEAARELFGLEAERSGVWLLRAVHPADRARAVELLRSAPTVRRWPTGPLPRRQEVEAAADEAPARRSPAGPPGSDLVELRVRAGEQWCELEVSHQVVSLSGAPAHILVGRDVTERRRLQAKMLMADRKSTRLNSSHRYISRMPSSA
jgi:PAS domain-containing protein